MRRNEFLKLSALAVAGITLMPVLSKRKEPNVFYVYPFGVWNRELTQLEIENLFKYGNQFPAFQDVMKLAKNGDTIIFKNGSYGT